MVLGQLDGNYILTSETCALDIIGAKFIREVENGEIVVITDNTIESIKPFTATNQGHAFLSISIFQDLTVL